MIDPATRRFPIGWAHAMTWPHAARGFVLCSLPCLLPASVIATNVGFVSDPDIGAVSSLVFIRATTELILLIILVPAIGALGDVLTQYLVQHSAHAKGGFAREWDIQSDGWADSPSQATRLEPHRLRLAAENFLLTILSAVLALLVLAHWPAASLPVPWLVTMYAVFLGIRTALDLVWNVSGLPRARVEKLLYSVGDVWNWHKTYLLAETGILYTAFLSVKAIRISADKDTLEYVSLPFDISRALLEIGAVLPAIGPPVVLTLLVMAAMPLVSAGFAVLGLISDTLCYGLRRLTRGRRSTVISFVELGIGIAAINGAYVSIGIDESYRSDDAMQTLTVIAGSLVGTVLIGVVLQILAHTLRLVLARMRSGA